uniref:Uncharacterized protein n=1 Tax=Cacopsylla melanoneura TaxID=428564 RepID=A0A8D8SFW7_9HEMI
MKFTLSNFSSVPAPDSKFPHPRLQIFFLYFLYFLFAFTFTVFHLSSIKLHIFTKIFSEHFLNIILCLHTRKSWKLFLIDTVEHYICLIGCPLYCTTEPKSKQKAHHCKATTGMTNNKL